MPFRCPCSPVVLGFKGKTHVFALFDPIKKGQKFLPSLLHQLRQIKLPSMIIRKGNTFALFVLKQGRQTQLSYLVHNKQGKNKILPCLYFIKRGKIRHCLLCTLSSRAKIRYCPLFTLSSTASHYLKTIMHRKSI